MTDAERSCPDFSLGYQAAHRALARWFKRRNAWEAKWGRKWLEN